MKLKKIMGALLATTLLFGCSSNQENKTPTDEDFVLNVAKGLEARWDLNDQDDTDSMSTSKLQKAYRSYIKAEKDQVGKLSKYKFKDKELKSIAEQYINGLELQEEGIQYVGTDNYSDQQKTWTLGYNYRIVSITKMAEDYGLTVDSKYQETLDDMIAEEPTAKRDVDIQDFVNNLQATLTYTKDESQSDEYHNSYTAIIENTTDYTINSMDLQLDFLDASGVTIGQSNDYLNDIAPGSKMQSTIEYYDLESKGEPASFKLTVTAYSN